MFLTGLDTQDSGDDINDFRVIHNALSWVRERGVSLTNLTNQLLLEQLNILIDDYFLQTSLTVSQANL